MDLKGNLGYNENGDAVFDLKYEEPNLHPEINANPNANEIQNNNRKKKQKYAKCFPLRMIKALAIAAADPNYARDEDKAIKTCAESVFSSLTEVETCIFLCFLTES